MYKTENKNGYNLFREMNRNILVDGWKGNDAQLGQLCISGLQGWPFMGDTDVNRAPGACEAVTLVPVIGTHPANSWSLTLVTDECQNKLCIINIYLKYIFKQLTVFFLMYHHFKQITT